MTSIGAVFLPYLPPERLRSVALAADQAGLEELWVWEDCFREAGISAVAAALAVTERLRVGIGLLPVPLRNVALTAMEATTLHRMFPGRPMIGVGHGVLDWMGQVGARAESPLTLLTEYLTALTALLAGEEVTTKGRYVKLDHVRLDWPPLAPVEVLAGAEGPKTLEVAGALADGTILPGGTGPDRVRAARERIDAGRGSAGRTDPHRLVVFVLAATGVAANERYLRELQQWGLDPGTDVGVAGNAADLADAVLRWADAGADTVILQPTRDDPDPEGFVRFVAEEVRPLVR